MLNNNNTTESIKKQVEIKQKENVLIKPNEVFKVSVQGKKFAECVKCAYVPKAHIKKISKTQYLELKTGKVKYYQFNDTKTNKNLRVVFRKLMGLIRENFTENSTNQLFLTLTYSENMKDAEKLYFDFKNFMKRLKYKLKDHTLEYIAVAEPQGRGAWHMHVMLKSTNQEVLYIDKRELTEIWGFGRTDCQRLKSDDVGTYYVAYFTDIIDESKLKDDADLSKARKKGARLRYYPVGFNFYRTSRGIKKPIEVEMTFDELIQEYGKPTYIQEYELIENIEESQERVLNTITRLSFKKKSNKSDSKKGGYDE